jgi:hypothetical protein
MTNYARKMSISSKIVMNQYKNGAGKYPSLMLKREISHINPRHTANAVGVGNISRLS